METTPSLENLIETEDIGVEIFHPGGLEITSELAGLCGIGKDTLVLDVASGTGESACFLADSLGAHVVGVDRSEYLLQRAREKAMRRNLGVEFKKGDAHNLEFSDSTFDAVISECTLCLLDKGQVLAEMKRVAKPGGHIGIDDVCWHAKTPNKIKEQLAVLEGERPETLNGWTTLFERAGLTNVQTVDRSSAMAVWTQSIKKSLGVTGQLKVFWQVVRWWGISGLFRVLQSERIFRSGYAGYGIVVGTKPLSGHPQVSVGLSSD